MSKINLYSLFQDFADKFASQLDTPMLKESLVGICAYVRYCSKRYSNFQLIDCDQRLGSHPHFEVVIQAGALADARAGRQALQLYREIKVALEPQQVQIEEQAADENIWDDALLLEYVYYALMLAAPQKGLAGPLLAPYKLGTHEIVNLSGLWTHARSWPRLAPPAKLNKHPVLTAELRPFRQQCSADGGPSF